MQDRGKFNPLQENIRRKMNKCNQSFFPCKESQMLQKQEDKPSMEDEY